MFQQLSTPIRALNNRTTTIPLGKAVGGGTIVNGMVVTRGQKQDYDAWEQLGNPGWGWDEIYKYFKKACQSSMSLPFCGANMLLLSPAVSTSQARS